MMVVLTFFLLQGCELLSPLQSDNTAWEGQRIDDLIASWGQPDRAKQLGIDYLAYTWTENAGNCEKTFLASDGLITGYSSSGCND